MLGSRVGHARQVCWGPGWGLLMNRTGEAGRLPAPPLSDPEVQQIVQTSARRIIRLCTQHGLIDDTQADRLADEEPVLSARTATWCGGPSPPGNARVSACDAP